MEIRRIKDINVALGVRLFWRMCTSQSLWAAWMSANYLKGFHLYQASPTILDSVTWKWIYNLKAQALSRMSQNIGNKVETSLLYDRWIPGSTDILIYQTSVNQLPADMHKWHVSDLIENGHWVLKSQVMLLVWQQILQQQTPISTAATDTRSWNCTSSGQFSFS